MNVAEIITLLLCTICLLAVVAERVNVASPIVFLLGGIALARVPGMDGFSIEPQQILTIFLPPLLMEAAFLTSLREFKKHSRAIFQLAVGLVLATATAIGWVFTQIVPGASLASGFVLGAIVSPPDAVAASSILKTVSVPKRIVAILEGESLVNDAVGLVLYRFAVAAVMTGQFSLFSAGWHFGWMILCGAGCGIALAFVYIRFFVRIHELSTQVLSTFVMPYIAYILSEACGGSGVLAVVVLGLYLSWHGPALFTPQFRITASGVWKMASFVLNALVFILIGLQMDPLLSGLSSYPSLTLFGYVCAVCATAVIVRFAYIFTVVYVPRFLRPKRRKADPYPPWQNVFLLGYIGMRGVVSMATALALPETLNWGPDFPYRDLITFLALALIVFTLVAQGLSLPWVLRKLTLSYDPKFLHEEWSARKQAATDALSRLEALEKADNANLQALKRIKNHYLNRLELLADGPNTPLEPGHMPMSVIHPLVQAENTLWQEVLNAERNAVLHLRKTYQIGDDAMHEILREIDLLSARFG
jgi:CPA1 family monovalent cation:H+ antiporter